MSLENQFQQFRQHVVGLGLQHELLGQTRDIIYADWTASGRLYTPIERYLSDTLGAYVANTHTETTLTGNTMTHAYHQAQAIIKKHVNANEHDVLIAQGSGMTGVVNKLQRILCLRVPERYADMCRIPDDQKPLVIITHMEHHSNQTSWEECDVVIEIIRRLDNGLPDLDHLRGILLRHQDRKLKIGAFSACSNVTGIFTPYYQMAEIMHEFGGYCFVDFAASAPYVDINMHPENAKQKLDAIMFSPHKFLGGPGSSGVMVFDSKLYNLKVPDHPGGGTVAWTNPWGGHRFIQDIEAREDGGTPAFLQTIKAALAIKLKESMGVARIKAREEEMKALFLAEVGNNPAVQLLEPQQKDRLCIFSFYSLEKHHNLIVKLLNDRFGVQVRGGCSCAGTYGHILLNVDQATSQKITCEIDAGDLTNKPGWVRVSLHPVMTDDEVRHIADAIKQVLTHYHDWKNDYQFDTATGEYRHKEFHDHYLNLDHISL